MKYINCLMCNEELPKRNKIFCSRKCYSQWQSINKKRENSPIWKERIITNCLNCKKEFEVRPYKLEIGFGKYCSKSCSNSDHIGESSSNWRGGNISRNCFICSIEFKVAPSKIKSGGGKYCSKSCFYKNHSESRIGEKNPSWKGGITPINLKIRNSKEYKAWRTSVFERDNYTCVWCNKIGGTLNADHIKPFSLFPELRLELSNGRTLCISCHKKTNTYGGLSQKTQGVMYK